MDERIKRLVKTSKTIKDMLNAVALEVQENCAHEECYECEYEESKFHGRAKPPCRICLECRLIEEGWGCGYKLLENSNILKTIDRYELYRMRIPGKAGQHRKN